MTIRQYKKKFFIGKDDNGKMIYRGDTVELHLPYETNTSYKSIVYWTRIDGAFVNGHPAHIKLNNGEVSHRFLRDFMGKKECPMYYENDEMVLKYTKCVKVKNFY